MAELKVEVLKIEKVIQHPNADRLDLATVLGYQVVTGRDQYKAGDCAVYFPVDSILPADLQDCIFAGSKMKLSRDRVRAARIRGAMSFGLLVDIPKIKNYYIGNEKREKVSKFYWKEGTDLTSDLCVTKYEPPVKNSPQRNTNAVAKRYAHPDFDKYTSIQHGKKNVKIFEDYTGPVVATEKIHGTNFRCGWVPFQPRTFFQRVLKIFSDWTMWNFVPEFEFVYGSHNVQLQDGNPKPGAPAYDNIYKRAVEDYSLKEAIDPGEIWYFEIFGDGIQKNYSYGMENGEYDIRVIDIKKYSPRAAKPWGFLSWVWVEKLCKIRGLLPAPVVHLWMNGITAIYVDRGLNSPSGRAHRSTLDNTTPMEGVVIRPWQEEVDTYAGRFIFKFISDEYLLNKSNTDFH